MLQLTQPFYITSWSTGVYHMAFLVIAIIIIFDDYQILKKYYLPEIFCLHILFMVSSCLFYDVGCLNCYSIIHKYIISFNFYHNTKKSSNYFLIIFKVYVKNVNKSTEMFV